MLVGGRRACLPEWAVTRVASRSMTSGPGGAAPSAHAVSRARPSADHSPATPRGSAGSSWATTRHAVEVEQTPPNSSGWSRKLARSPNPSPPSASITTRSRSTAPRSWPPARRPRLARRPSWLVSPTVSAASASSRHPAWLTRCSPSAVTRMRGRGLVGCTGKVTSLVGSVAVRQPHPPWPGRSLATRCQPHQQPREMPRLGPQPPKRSSTLLFGV
jgi:hypothetical protein